jgi:hypothetical protein
LKTAEPNSYRAKVSYLVDFYLVYSFLCLSIIVRASSVVMASSPQPNDNKLNHFTVVMRRCVFAAAYSLA